MPFDLARAASRLRAAHGGSLEFRHAMLDLLFATGCPVREQAMALEYGDALAMEVAGPAAPSLEPPLVVVVVDIEPPHLPRVAQTLGEPARWGGALTSLGGPQHAVAWAAVLRALASSPGQRPWRAHYVRGPAMGLAEAIPMLIGEAEAEAEVVLVTPSVTEAWGDEPVDVVQVDLTRARNVWRFPACDHTYALSADVPWQAAASALSDLVDDLGPGISWTLHDLHIYPAGQVHISAVLRTSAPLAQPPQGFRLTEVTEEQRLMFPVNDALGGLRSLASRMGGVWGDALHQPLHLHVLPDGMRAFALIPAAGDPALPGRVGSLSVEHARSPLIGSAPGAILPFATGASEVLGPLPALAARADLVWQLPTLDSDEDLAGLSRALDNHLRS